MSRASVTWALLTASALSGCAAQRVAALPDQLAWTGRVDGQRFAWGGTAFEVRFEGTAASVTLSEQVAPGFETGRFPNRYRIELDGKVIAEPVAPLASTVPLEWTWSTPALEPGPHALRWVKETEGGVGEATVRSVEVRGRVLAPAARPTRKLEFLGDSLTAGFGALGTAPCPFSSETEGHSVAFAAVAARALGAEANFIAFSGRGVTRNYDDRPPAERMPELWRRTLPGQSEPTWDFSRFQPDAVVVLLGANDFGRGDPGEIFVAAYAGLLERIRAVYPGAYVLALSREKRVALTAYVQRAVEARQAEGDARLGVAVLPAATAEEGTGCVGHPSAATHRRYAEVVVQALHAALGWTSN